MRTHSPKTQYEIRKQVIRLRKQGIANQVLAEGVGISISHASRIWQSYLKEDSTTITMRVRGRQKGEKRTITTEQEAQIKRDLIDKTPGQLKLPSAVWTRDVVKLLIKHRFRVEMPIRTVGEYLKRWGFNALKPVKRAYEQSSEVVKKWLETDYPSIASRAKEEKAEIHWGDQTGI